MSTSRVKKITRALKTSNVVITGAGPYTFTLTTTAAHGLDVGDVIDAMIFANSNQIIQQITTLAGTTGSTIVFEYAEKFDVNKEANLIIGFYNTGMTDGQATFSLPIHEGARGIVQSYVSGTGGASYKLQGSLNGVNWTDIATVTHAGIDGDSTSTGIVDPWMFFRINITSIGAATKLYVLAAS